MYVLVLQLDTAVIRSALDTALTCTVHHIEVGAPECGGCICGFAVCMFSFTGFVNCNLCCL